MDTADNGHFCEGASCVQAYQDGDGSKASLYIVGGLANSSTTRYSGLQRYSFSDKKWEDITPLVSVTKNRQSMLQRT
jgi:hypothetical protein